MTLLDVKINLIRNLQNPNRKVAFWWSSTEYEHRLATDQRGQRRFPSTFISNESCHYQKSRIMRLRDTLAIWLMSLVAMPLWADDVKKEVPAKLEPAKVQATAGQTIDIGVKAATENCKDGHPAVAGSRSDSTHKQARVITPQHNGKKIGLNTFCLTPTGDLLLCVGGPSVEYALKPDQPGEYDIKHIKQDALVQIYSPDEKLLKEIELDFKPTAINMVPGSKEFVVAGEGWLARLTLDGELIKKSRTPNVGNLEEFKAKALKEAKAQAQQFTSQFDTQIKQAEKKLAKLLEKPEADRTKAIKAQIEAQETLIKQYKEQLVQVEASLGVGDPEAAVNDKLTVTAVAATEKDVFMSLKKLNGHGYDVWRTTHDFTDGEKIVEDLGGCCGQMDIQASKDNLLVAENGKFQVGIYDRDGEMTKSFGKRDRKSPEGFGSCCNPMNVRCCADGTILTAESSIGDIKRFSPEGKMVGYIGRAKIAGGCKHVALEFDAARNRYYMQHQDKGHICVLVPVAEITGPTEDELLAKAAREGLGAKLVGTWSMQGAKKAKSGITGVVRSVFGAGGATEGVADQLTFGENGELKATGGMLSIYSRETSLEWVATKQADNHLTVGVVMDGVENFNFKVTFNTDDTVKIELRSDDSVMATSAYQRDAKPTETIDATAKPVGDAKSN